MKNKGITLVALVLTIIILLILSGIAISSLTNTGLLKNASMASNKYKISQIEEKMKLAKLELEMSSENKSIKDVFIKNGTINEEQADEGLINFNDSSIFITNFEGLQKLSNMAKSGEDFSNKYVYIINNIDCYNSFDIESGELQKGENFEPILNFNGSFDGNDYIIKNLYIKTETNGAALISKLNEGGTVKNLIIDNSYIDGNKEIGCIVGKNYGTISKCISQNSKIIGNGDTQGTFIGGICGYNLLNGKIMNCVNKSEIISKYKLCGGICGYSLEGNISDCVNYGKVTGSAQVGGIVGDSEGKQNNIVFVADCINYGIINEKHTSEQPMGYIGGIVGCNYKWSEIINCINKANVNGTSTSIGGIAGINHYNIKKCYNEGKIESKRTEIISATRWLSLGGICGYNSGNIEQCGNLGEVKSNYNTEDDSDGVYVGGISGVITVSNSKDVFDSVKISKCYNYGIINGQKYIGGITGRVSTNSNIEYCFNNGKIIGDDKVGGITGTLPNNNTKICSCYNFGEISGNSNFGGVCGIVGSYVENSYSIGKIDYDNSSNYYGTLFGAIWTGANCVNCYYLDIICDKGVGYEQTSGLANSVIGKSEEELKKLAEILGEAYSQDYDNINNGYPYLKENIPIK